jgi:hypothetical protein
VHHYKNTGQFLKIVFEEEIRSESSIPTYLHTYIRLFTIGDECFYIFVFLTPLYLHNIKEDFLLGEKTYLDVSIKDRSLL